MNDVNVSEDANKNTVSNEAKWIGGMYTRGIHACAKFECLADILGNRRFVDTTSRMKTSACWAGKVFVIGKGCSTLRGNHG